MCMCVDRGFRHDSALVACPGFYFPWARTTYELASDMEWEEDGGSVKKRIGITTRVSQCGNNIKNARVHIHTVTGKRE